MRSPPVSVYPRRYDGSHIIFYYLETQTFPITYMDSQVTYNATVVSGTMSSNGSSGGSASDAISGDASNTQTTTVDMKSALYQDVKKCGHINADPGYRTHVHVHGLYNRHR